MRYGKAMTTPVTAIRMRRLDGPALKLVWKAVVQSYDPDTLERELAFADRRLADISGPGNFQTVVFKVLEDAQKRGWMAEFMAMLIDSSYPDTREIGTRMLEQYGSSAAEPVLSPAASPNPGPNLATQPGATSPSGLAVGDPYGSQLVGEQIFINRTKLRAHLKDLLSASRSRVLVVTGDRPCGKSYTWFYVRQRELLGEAEPVLIDLKDWTEPVSPVDLMSSIALQLRLPEPVIDQYAQGAAQARRLRDWLVGQLRPQEDSGRWLLVFDSLDHVAQRDETLQLIELLAGAAITQVLPGLRMILLGYVNRLPIDPLETVLTEPIEDIGEPELRDFYRALARQAGVAITDEAIELAVRAVLNLLPADREGKLYQLAKTVREVGNAAFGMRLLP